MTTKQLSKIDPAQFTELRWGWGLRGLRSSRGAVLVAQGEPLLGAWVGPLQIERRLSPIFRRSCLCDVVLVGRATRFDTLDRQPNSTQPREMNMNAFKKTLVAIAAVATLGATGLASTQASANGYGYGYGSYGYGYVLSLVRLRLRLRLPLRLRLRLRLATATATATAPGNGRFPGFLLDGWVEVWLSVDRPSGRHEMSQEGPLCYRGQRPLGANALARATLDSLVRPVRATKGQPTWSGNIHAD